MSDKEIQDYTTELGKLGFCWQFITLAGFHLDALAVDTFAADYSQRGMLAYVEKIQRLERNFKVETLTHQQVRKSHSPRKPFLLALLDAFFFWNSGAAQDTSTRSSRPSTARAPRWPWAPG